jgi:hypothetical protein
MPNLKYVQRERKETVTSIMFFAFVIPDYTYTNNRVQENDD